MDISVQAISVLAFPLPPQVDEAVSQLWPLESNWRPHVTLAYPPFIRRGNTPLLAAGMRAKDFELGFQDTARLAARVVHSQGGLAGASSPRRRVPGGFLAF